MKTKRYHRFLDEMGVVLKSAANIEFYFDVNQCILLLLFFSFSVDPCWDQSHRTALMQAAAHGHLEVVHALLKVKADCNFMNKVK